MKKIMGIVVISTVGIIGIAGCASTIDSLSNNSSGVQMRGTKMTLGVNSISGTPAPSVDLIVGSLQRKGKGDRCVMTTDNTGATMVSEDYNIVNTYENIVGDSKKDPRQMLKSETRTANQKQFEAGITVDQSNKLSFGLTSGNLFSTGGDTRVTIGNQSSIPLSEIPPSPVPTPIISSSPVPIATGH